uniref:Uncharacterized protein LOC111100740 n=1 Tax=Crassostrea virginica TaxID=6565 RepID=A0A8B8ABI5_CRAVI|nr:uncharacterized protein LOC111100740 [Crassostrea virginica]
MPVLKRRSACIGQRKKHHSKRPRSQSESCVSDHQFHDHGYCSSPVVSTSVANDEDQIQQPSSENIHHNNWTSQVISGIADQEEEILIVEDGHVILPSPSLPEFTEESNENEDPLILLKEELLSVVCSAYTVTYHQQQHAIEILELYKHEEQTSSVKLSVVIGKDLQVNIYVHRTLIPESHMFWNGLPRQAVKAADVCKILGKLENYGVCVGNPDEEFQDLTPTGCGLSHATSEEILAFKEGDFGAVQGNLKYSSTIRSIKCEFLVEGARCVKCSGYRQLLRERKCRMEEQKKREISLKSTYKHSDMTRDMLYRKLSLQKTHIESLQTEVERMNREMKLSIDKGVKLNEIQNQEMKDLMGSCQDDMEKEFPDHSCYQRLFWEQQKKYEKQGKHGMRWHPMMIKLCLYLRQKSSKAYESLRTQMSATAYERLKDTSVVTVIFNVYTGKSVVTTIDILFISIFFLCKSLKIFWCYPH